MIDEKLIKKCVAKVTPPKLIEELIRQSGGDTLLEINEETPKKIAQDMMLDAMRSQDIDVHITIEENLLLALTAMTPQTRVILKELYQNESGKTFEPLVECLSDFDYALYALLHEPNLFTRLTFIIDFYKSKAYTKTETKQTSKENLESRVATFLRESNRIAGKGVASEPVSEYEFGGRGFFFRVAYEGGRSLTPKINTETKELDSRRATKSLEFVHLIYLYEESLVLVRGKNKEKSAELLDCFMRVMCEDTYLPKEEIYDLSVWKDFNFDLILHEGGVGMLTWKITNVTLSYAEGKKRLRLSLPSPQHVLKFQPLIETLDELGMKDSYKNLAVESVGITITFKDRQKEDGVVKVNTSISPKKCSLCPLFEYEAASLKVLEKKQVFQGRRLIEV